MHCFLVLFFILVDFMVCGDVATSDLHRRHVIGSFQKYIPYLIIKCEITFQDDNEQARKGFGQVP